MRGFIKAFGLTCIAAAFSVLARSQANPAAPASSVEPPVQTHLEVGIVSMSTTPWAEEDNFERLEAYVREAARRRAQLVVAPEGVLDGYPAGADPDVTKKRMLSIAQTLPDGPYLKRAAKLCLELHIFLVFGFLETAAGDLFNACAMFDPHGRIIARYRKVRPSGESFIMGGRELRTFSTPFGRVGFLICEDRGVVDNFATLGAQGIQILLIPMNGSGGPDNTAMLRQRARDFDCAIVVANTNSSVIIDRHGETTLVKYETETVSVGQIYYNYDIDWTGADRGQFLGRRPDLYGPLAEPPPPGAAFDANGRPTPAQEKAREEAREKLRRLPRADPVANGP